MPKVTLDQALRDKLNSVKSQVELCDEAGHTVGYFLSADWHRQLLYAYAKTLVTEQELEEARRQTGGRPLKEILADLETKGCATP